jgi:hypothetical protein
MIRDESRIVARQWAIDLDDNEELPMGMTTAVDIDTES